ncbi:hypothetical protein [Rhizobium sp. NPDC090279]|uniref:hypothetical protein n=1 Tax=Rhizobium sp. NPDC090279 TaxID=3364499 RepID=UPI003839E8BA
MTGILKMIVAGICVVLLASGAFTRWPIASARKTDDLQKRMTDCDQNIDQLVRLHDGDIETLAWDRNAVEGNVKACLTELKDYFYVTVARTKLKAKGVPSFRPTRL